MSVVSIGPTWDLPVLVVFFIFYLHFLEKIPLELELAVKRRDWDLNPDAPKGQPFQGYTNLSIICAMPGYAISALNKTIALMDSKKTTIVGRNFRKINAATKIQKQAIQKKKILAH